MQASIRGSWMIFSLVLSGISCIAQQRILVKFELDKKYLVEGAQSLISVQLRQCDSGLSLMEMHDGKENPVSFECVNGQLSFLLKVRDGKSDYEFVLKKGKAKSLSGPLNVDRTRHSIVFTRGRTNLLEYRSAVMYAPSNVDSAYARGAFIHPICTPSGDTLTLIQPWDHYHHYGLWNPWTHLLFEGDTLDCWNLAKKQGTVRFKDILLFHDGLSKKGLRVKHEHVKFSRSTEKVMFHEEQQITMPNSLQDHSYQFDLDITYRCATDSAVRLLQYRYGGLGFRATARWNETNSEVLTSEGARRSNADGSRARWCIVQGQLSNGNGGMLILSGINNFNHPEPLRVWPVSDDNGGAVFVNFSPTKDRDWLLIPGNDYSLRYRFIVYDGKMTSELAEAYWQIFVHTPSVVVR